MLDAKRVPDAELAAGKRAGLGRRRSVGAASGP
jgi:hypothetical protein